MHIRFCELYTKYIEYEDFINFLTTQSLKDTTSEYKISILKLYKEIFTNISNILTYVKRVLDINKLDNIYVGSGINITTKLHEIAEVELKIKSSDFNFNYGFKNSDVYVEQLHSLMHIYVNSPTHLRYKNNFNIYNRPLKFTQRQSGKISLVVASSLLLSFSFPIYYWLLTLTNNTRYEELHIEYKKKHKIKQTREIQIIEKLEAKTKLLKILQKEKQNYKNTENILMKIYDIRVNYHMKANLLYLLTKDLNKKNVKVESIKYGENNSKILTLNLVSNKDKKITDLLKCLTSKYQNKFHFSLTKISFDERENKYFSTLNVGL